MFRIRTNSSSDGIPTDDTTDIDSLAESGMTNPRLMENYNVEVRDFVIIACVCDAGPLTASEISSQVHLAPTTTRSCLDFLVANGLLTRNGDQPAVYAPTWDGHALVRKSAHPPAAGSDHVARSDPATTGKEEAIVMFNGSRRPRSD